MNFEGELRLKEDAEQLISEAIELLKETSSPTENAMRRTQQDVQSPTMPRRHKDEKDKTSFDIDKTEVDRSNSVSPEQSFWFKLADSLLDRSK